MENSRKIVILEIILICILLVTCIIIEVRYNQFKRDCYKEYDINGTCPCKEQKLENPNNLNYLFNNTNN